MFEDGSLNLVIIDLTLVTDQNPVTDLSHSAIQKITEFSLGEQVFRPVWHPDGETIYFAHGNADRQHIQSVNLSSDDVSIVIASDQADYRDPYISADGSHLYYASDETGIFNIYRMDLQSGKNQQLTSVLGGALCLSSMLNKISSILST